MTRGIVSDALRIVPPACRETSWAPTFDRSLARDRAWSPIGWDPAVDPPNHRTQPYWDLDGEA